MLHSYRQDPEYRKRQSITAKNSWKKRQHNLQIRSLETRICKNRECGNKFSVKPYDPKVFCSRSCAVYFNNLGRKHTRETKLKIANSLSSIPVTVLRSEMPRKPGFLPFNITPEKLRRLYVDDQLSSGEIAKKFDVSVFRVIKKLQKYKIPRRTSAESNNIVYMKKPLTYNIKKNLTEQEKLLLTSAIMLYWAEGAKRGKWSIDFTNSDERMVLIFLMALRKIYRVDESKIRVLLYCYSNQNVDSLISYWSKLLEIPKSKFIKPYVRRNFDPKNIGRMAHGVAHIRYTDKKLLMQIKRGIDIIQSELIG